LGDDPTSRPNPHRGTAQETASGSQPYCVILPTPVGQRRRTGVSRSCHRSATCAEPPGEPRPDPSGHASSSKERRPYWSGIRPHPSPPGRRIAGRPGLGGLPLRPQLNPAPLEPAPSCRSSPRCSVPPSPRTARDAPPARPVKGGGRSRPRRSRQDTAP
jgi:hypothetical protein